MPTSEHASYDELKCTCKGAYCDGGVDMIHPRLLKLYEMLRKNMGGYPIKINCAYRCPQRNAEVGGVDGSQHTKGTAMDIAINPHYTTLEQKWFAEQVRDEVGGFDAIGTYSYDPTGNTKGDGFLHLDVRFGGVSQGPEDIVTWSDMGA